MLGGERGIRTPGGVTLNGFQDRRNRPLCHLSERMILSFGSILFSKKYLDFHLTSAKVGTFDELCKSSIAFFPKIRLFVQKTEKFVQLTCHKFHWT